MLDSLNREGLSEVTFKSRLERGSKPHGPRGRRRMAEGTACAKALWQEEGCHSQETEDAQISEE